MSQLMVVGNWKMHGTSAMAAQLVPAITADASLLTAVDVALLPPFVYLTPVRELVGTGIVRIGAQNLSPYVEGAYTGEVSASQLADVGCHLVLVGHSERRALYAESDELVAAKYQAAQDAGLIPILCLGETQAERAAGQTMAVVMRQLNAVLDLAGVASLANAVIAYEPVWAIGTGLTATPAEAQSVHADVRELIAEHDATIARQVRLLYGGSVKPANAAALFAEADIDGGLIGGAALSAEAFMGIVQHAAACQQQG